MGEFAAYRHLEERYDEGETRVLVERSSGPSGDQLCEISHPRRGSTFC
jgi:hypothetical protein